MLANFLLVALGGALGSVARYGLSVAWTVQRAAQATPLDIPWGTLGSNILGSFFIGLFAEWAGRKMGLGPEARLFLTTGFCGGFTTLSSLMLELNNFLRHQDWGTGLLYLGLSLVLPFVALWLGIGLVGMFAKD